MANEQARSAAAQGNARPSWQQRFALPLRKGTLQEGQPVLAVFQAVDSSWKSALGGSIIGGRDLGTGSLDILSLLNGSRGSHVRPCLRGLRCRAIRSNAFMSTGNDRTAHPFSQPTYASMSTEN